jgi:hypothetical protein
MENHGGMMSTEETSDSYTRTLWQTYQQPSGSKQEEIEKEMIYELGEPRWNDVDRGTRAPWQSYQQSFGSKQEERTKEMMNLALRSTLFVLASNLLHAVTF